MTDEAVKLVLARLEAMPSSIKVHLGSHGTLTKSDLIQHVKKQDEFGKLFIEMQLKYIKQMTKCA